MVSEELGEFGAVGAVLVDAELDDVRRRAVEEKVIVSWRIGRCDEW